MSKKQMSTFAYALLENYEVYGNTEDEEELCTRDNLIEYIAELEAERDQAKAIVSRLRDFLFDYTQFHISTNPEERWWALVDKFDELVKEREE